MPDLAISTWSLHRTLGPIYPSLDVHDGPRASETPYGPGELTLLDVPAYIAAMGIHLLEICHFHFPRTDAAYLTELRDACRAAQVTISTILIDAGDIAAADPFARSRDIDRIRSWIDVAGSVEATRVRIVAGMTPADPDGVAVRHSIESFRELAPYAEARGVAVITENWQALTQRPQDLLAILDGLQGALGLCADFGNYRGPTREDDLRAILPRAITVHAKADWRGPGSLDAAGFVRCLDLARDAGFQGSYVLIFDDPGDERAGIMQLAEVVQPYLAA